MNDRLLNLDLLRGLAALAVCASHLRAFLFADFQQTAATGTGNRLFYLATGLGHQAVVVFFVLSGYLIGGNVLRAYRTGRWSWPDYALRRMSRLWVVLLPALAATLVLDSFGSQWAPAGYRGEWHGTYHSGPAADAPADLRAATLLGNAFFLQTICVDCFGTNAPLWSLANEFWYYALFPLLCGAVLMRSLPGRLVSAALALALIWWLPRALLASGLVWLIGTAAFVAGQNGRVRRVCGHPAWLIAAGATSLGALALSKSGSSLGGDLAIGVAFALWIVGLAAREQRGAWLNRVSSGLSNISYTLYVVHFPFLALVVFCGFHGARFAPGAAAYIWFAALLAATLLYASAMWWCFERNTGRVRAFVERLILSGRSYRTEGAHV